jgi:hypothetical protein
MMAAERRKSQHRGQRLSRTQPGLLLAIDAVSFETRFNPTGQRAAVLAGLARTRLAGRWLVVERLRPPQNRLSPSRHDNRILALST